MCSQPKSYRPGSGHARINTSPVKKLAYLFGFTSSEQLRVVVSAAIPSELRADHEAKVLKAEADPAGNCICIIAIAA